MYHVLNLIAGELPTMRWLDAASLIGQVLCPLLVQIQHKQSFAEMHITIDHRWRTIAIPAPTPAPSGRATERTANKAAVTTRIDFTDGCVVPPYRKAKRENEVSRARIADLRQAFRVQLRLDFRAKFTTLDLNRWIILA